LEGASSEVISPSMFGTVPRTPKLLLPDALIALAGSAIW
jgi:hypothetical protein